jgi:hypothetical protein
MPSIVATSAEPSNMAGQIQSIIDLYKTGELYSKITLAWQIVGQHAELMNMLRMPRFTLGMV